MKVLHIKLNLHNSKHTATVTIMSVFIFCIYLLCLFAEKDKNSETDGIDLKCQEHVSDSETDSTPEDDIIENKAFPQQRFSPVMKHINSSDITYRPKPIKRMPDTGKVVSDSPAGGTAGQKNGMDRMIPRPSSNGSNFQPTGAVFKAKAKQSRYMSTGSVHDNRSNIYEHHTRTESVSSPRSVQHMKIHNITMVTGEAEKIIMSSNTESPFGNNQNNRGGAIMGKFSQRAPLKLQCQPASAGPSILQQTLQTGNQNNRPVSTATLQIVANPQQAVMSQQPTVSQTYAAMDRSITSTPGTPGLTAAVLHTGNYSSAPSAVHQQQPNHHNTSAGLKNVGIVLQGVPASQYNMILGSNTAVASPTASKLPTLSMAGQGQIITSSLQTLASSSASQAHTAMPPQSAAPPTVLTNFMIKTGQGGQSIQPALNSPLPTQANQQFNQTFQPTHVQYILPSIRMQNPAPGARFPNHVIQMALPGTPVPQGSFQLAFTGNQATPTTQGLAQIQQVQVSPQQVHTPVQGGKIQLQTGYKVVQSPMKQHPSPAASPQLNTAPQTIQVISQNVQQNKPTSVTQYLALNQSQGILAPPHPVQIQANNQSGVAKQHNAQLQVK